MQDGRSTTESDYPTLQHSITPGFISSLPLSRSLEVARYLQNLSVAPAWLSDLCRQENPAPPECLRASGRATGETAATRCCNCNPTRHCPGCSCTWKEF